MSTTTPSATSQWSNWTQKSRSQGQRIHEQATSAGAMFASRSARSRLSLMNIAADTSLNFVPPSAGYDCRRVSLPETRRRWTSAPGPDTYAGGDGLSGMPASPVATRTPPHLQSRRGCFPQVRRLLRCTNSLRCACTSPLLATLRRSGLICSCPVGPQRFDTTLTDIQCRSEPDHVLRRSDVSQTWP